MYATFSLPIEPTEPTTATDSSAETTQPVTGDYIFGILLMIISSSILEIGKQCV